MPCSKRLLGAKRKVFLSLLLTALMLIIATVGCCANAEEKQEIQLPAGLKFGMTLDEATAVSGYHCETSPSDGQTAMLKSVGFDTSGYLIGDATIGGKKASVSVYFVGNKLTQVEYSFVRTEVPGSMKGNDPECQKSYDSVEESLELKYGSAATKDQAEHRYKTVCLNYEWNGGALSRSSLGADKTTRVVSVEENGTVYIDNILEDWMQGKGWPDVYYYQRHAVTYTYYDFQLTETTNSNNVDF